jgi:hypothetical protein
MKEIHVFDSETFTGSCFPLLRSGKSLPKNVEKSSEMKEWMKEIQTVCVGEVFFRRN